MVELDILRIIGFKIQRGHGKPEVIYLGCCLVDTTAQAIPLHPVELEVLRRLFTDTLTRTSGLM
jgi:hypothetical protein